MNSPSKFIEELTCKANSIIKVETLTLCVNITSRAHKVPYSSYKTGTTRKIQHYKCSLANKCNCKSYIKFKFENGFHIVDACWKHSHSLDEYFIQSHINCCSKEIISNIHEQQKFNISPGQIRSNLGLTIPSKQFYEIRRSIIKFQKEEDFNKLIDFLKDDDFQCTLSKNDNNILSGITMVNQRVSSTSYAKNIVFVDDTALTNEYDWPLEVMIVIDQEGKDQLLAFGLFPDRTTSSFFEFFVNVRKMTKFFPRVIISDRSEAQTNGIENAYPESIHMFCLRHLGKDLLKYFKNDSEIIQTYYNMINYNFLSYDKFINLLNNKISHMENSIPGKNTLKWMINNLSSWLPIIYIENGIINDWTTNRVEGFFGSFKKTFGFKKISISQLCKNLIIHSKTLLQNSLSSRSSSNSFYSNICCIHSDDIPKIGRLALNIISKEYTDYRAGKDNFPFCRLCIMRKKNSDSTLPCRHLMNENNTIISLEQIPSFYLREDKELLPTIFKFQNKIFSPKLSLEYSDIMAQIAPFASIAKYNPNIANEIKNSIQRLEKLKPQLSSGMPNKYIFPGSHPMHPSKNVILEGSNK